MSSSSGLRAAHRIVDPDLDLYAQYNNQQKQGQAINYRNRPIRQRHRPAFYDYYYNYQDMVPEESNKMSSLAAGSNNNAADSASSSPTSSSSSSPSDVRRHQLLLRQREQLLQRRAGGLTGIGGGGLYDYDYPEGLSTRSGFGVSGLGGHQVIYAKTEDCDTNLHPALATLVLAGLAAATYIIFNFITRTGRKRSFGREDDESLGFSSFLEELAEMVSVGTLVDNCVQKRKKLTKTINVWPAHSANKAVVHM